MSDSETARLLASLQGIKQDFDTAWRDLTDAVDEMRTPPADSELADHIRTKIKIWSDFKSQIDRMQPAVLARGSLLFESAYIEQAPRGVVAHLPSKISEIEILDATGLARSLLTVIQEISSPLPDPQAGDLRAFVTSLPDTLRASP